MKSDYEFNIYHLHNRHRCKTEKDISTNECLDFISIYTISIVDEMRLQWGSKSQTKQKGGMM